MSSSSDDESGIGGSTSGNGSAMYGDVFAGEEVANPEPTIGNHANGVFPDGDYVDRALGPLSTAMRSRRSVDTAATSFDEDLASRVAPIVQQARSPNPLRVPQPSLESLPWPVRPLSPVVSIDETPLPAVAAVKIDAFVTTAFG